MSRFRGIIGGILGGIIASIPWVIIYVYGGWILSLLAILIGLGVSFGYRSFKGKIDSKLPWIIGAITILIVLIITIFVAPMLEMANEGYSVSINNWLLFFQDSALLTSMIYNIIISLVFAILGVSVVFNKTKSQINQ